MVDHYSYIDPIYNRGLAVSLPPTLPHFGKNGNHMNLDPNLPCYLDTASTASPLGLTTPTDGSDTSSSQTLLPDSPDPLQASPIHSRRLRKDKSRIELAPDQPPTTQGRPRARVFVACIQCRGRKIRCDGAKPMCYHCSQREGDEQCTYDVQPKRRGPDRIQGARSRGTTSKDGNGERPRRRRRRAAAVDRDRPPQGPDPIARVHPQQNGVRISTPAPITLEPPGSNGRHSSGTPHNQALTFESLSNQIPLSAARDVEDDSEKITYPTASASYGEAIPASYAVTAKIRWEQVPSYITSEPSVQFSRKIWWDHLIYQYAAFMRTSYGPSLLGQLQRDACVGQIIKDVRFILRSSSHHFSFLNVPRFYSNFMDPVRRNRMQPSLLLSLLALSTFLQSSERTDPEESRRTAVLLRDGAQAALEASLQTRAIDEELAQAAYILSFFEVCAHPQHQMTRIYSSLNILDSIIRALGMSYLDADNPTVSTFLPNAVPVVDVSAVEYFASPQRYLSSSPMQQYLQQQQQIVVDPTIFPSGCSCDELSLGRRWPEAQRLVPLWVATPAWNSEWSMGEIRKEECRRLCWSTLGLISGHTSYAAAANWRSLDLFMVEPSNYSILFPGESLLSSYPHVHFDIIVGKDTVWALYNRAMLLWNACVRSRHNTSISDLDRRDFAMRAWMETEAIEKALERHTCSIERAFMFHGREFLFNTRMCISYEFQRYIPHVLIGLNRQKSEEWLRAQGQRAKAVVQHMHAITGNTKNTLVQRPWFLWWFMGQVSRALTLWQQDNSLTIALDVCKAFLEPIKFLTTVYPGAIQRLRYDELRERVQRASLEAEAMGQYVPTPIEML